jgi:hypothetical protein
VGVLRHLTCGIKTYVTLKSKGDSKDECPFSNIKKEGN